MVKVRREESVNIRKALEADLAGIDAALKKLTDDPEPTSTKPTQQFKAPKPTLADLEYGALKLSPPKLTQEKSVGISDEEWASRTSAIIRGGKSRTAFAKSLREKSPTRVAERRLKSPKPTIVAKPAPSKPLVNVNDAQPTLKIIDYAAHSKRTPILPHMPLQIKFGMFERPFITFFDPIFFNANPIQDNEPTTAEKPDPTDLKKT